MVKFVAPPQGSRWLLGNVSLNDNDAVAMFDTGASRSTVTTGVAQRPGLAPETTVSDSRVFHGVGQKAVPGSVARFASLTIGQETIKNPSPVIADIFGEDRNVQTGSYIKQSAFTEPDLIIGADFFRAHRVYIARGQGKMYFTYLGGPIFDIVAQPAPPADSVPGASSAPADSSKPPEH